MTAGFVCAPGALRCFGARGGCTVLQTVPRRAALARRRRAPRQIGAHGARAIFGYGDDSASAGPPLPVAVEQVVMLPSARYTEALGRLVGQTAQRGDVILLRGELGAGKTSFARGYVREARRDPLLDVTSPTFVMDSSYPPEKWEREEAGDDTASLVPTIHHMDLWRLTDASEQVFVDFDTVFKNEVSLVEWPERLGTAVPERRLEVDIVFIQDADAPGPGEEQIVMGVSDAKAWGFEDDEDEYDGGRFATLRPVGSGWPEKLSSLEVSMTMLRELCD